MCGICGYTGWNQAAPILREMLKIMESYRLGFESAGIATIQGSELAIFKDVGSVDKVFPKGGSWLQALQGRVGIGHTRYPAKIAPVGMSRFAHPFTSCDERIALVHNGVIYSYREIWRELSGHHFSSLDEKGERLNDSEVIVHLLEEKITEAKGNIIRAVSETCNRLSEDPENTYLFAFVHLSHPTEIYVVSGRGNGRYVVVANKREFGSIFASYRDHGIEGRKPLKFEAIKPFIDLDRDQCEVLPFNTLAILTPEGYSTVPI